MDPKQHDPPQMQASLEQVQRALAAADLATWEMDLATKAWSHRSPGHDQLFGYPQPQAHWSLATAERHMLDEDRPALRVAFAQALETGRLSLEARVRWPDGTTHWIELRARTHDALAGRPVRLAGVVMDITERRAAEEPLRRSHEAFHALVESSPFGIVLIDADFRLRQISQGARHLLAELAPLLGRDYGEVQRLLWGEPGASEVVGLVRHTLQTGASYHSAQTMIPRRDTGEVKAYDWQLERVLLPDGRFGVAAYFYDLSERLAWEEALRDSEKRLRLAMEAGGMGVFDWELASDRLLWDTRQYEMFDIDPAQGELTGAAALARLHPDDRVAVEAAVCHASQAGEEMFPLEFRVVQADGSLRWIAAHGQVVFGPSGQALRLVGLNFDVTRVREAQAALERSIEAERVAAERVQLALAAGAIIGTWMWDLSGNTITVDECFAQSFGIDPALGRTGLSMEQVVASVHPDDLPGLRTAITEAIAHGGPYSREYRVRGRDGAYRWVQANGRVELAADGTPLRFPGVLLDVQHRRMLETERDRALELLRAFTDAVPGVIYAKDRDGRMLVANRGVTELIGKPADLYLGKTDLEFLDDPAQAQTVRANDRRIMDSGVAEQLEETVSLPDGTPAVWLSTKAPFRDNEGRVIGIIGASVDITARKAAEHALAELNATLEQRVVQRTVELAATLDAAEAANRAKNAFLANMSHEIRTPMNAILGLAHLLAHEDATAWQVQQLGKIEGAARHLLTIINDILDLSRIDAGKLELEERDIELPRLLEQVRSIVSDSAAAKGLRVDLDASALPRWLRGDETRLRQALLNYAGNAVKFTTAGCISLRARVLDEREGRLLTRFEVEDTGAGVDPQQLPRLFKAFEQADASTTREHGGTGLGLAITKRLAELMGGSAGAQVLSGGSLFWFTAWLKRGARVPVDGAVMPARADAELRQRHAGARVLLVEDNLINREVAMAMLRGAGLDVEFAEDGQSALEKVRQGTYRLVLMDMHMPVMDGLQATRALRATPGLQGLPILAMTANAYDEDRTACLAAGMDDFVTKPVEPQTLYATLLKWLDRGSVA